SVNADDRLALQAADEPAKQPAKKEDPAKKEKPAKKADEPAKIDEDLEKALEDLPAETREHVKKMLERMERGFPADGVPNADGIKNEMGQMCLGMARQGGGRFGGGGFAQFGEVAGFGSAGHGRLGVIFDKPSDALVEQLDLPKGQGLVITRVEPN